MGMKYLIIGGGIAGLTAAETIRANSPEADIRILEAGPHRPYLRPLLSKTGINYLAGTNMEIHPEEWYDRKRITLTTNCPVVSINAEEHTVTCKDGTILPYDRLI